MADPTAAAVEKIAAITEQDLQLVAEQVKVWIDAGLALPLGSARKAGDVAAVSVACCLVKLTQIGLADTALSEAAEVLRTLAAAPLAEHDTWIVSVSGGVPAVIYGRAQLIDAVGRAKGAAVVILDVGAIFRKVRA